MAQLKCSRCGSAKIMRNLRIRDRGESNVSHDLEPVNSWFCNLIAIPLCRARACSSQNLTQNDNARFSGPSALHVYRKTRRVNTRALIQLQPHHIPMKHSKIPQTDSIQELAQFWDTHDLTDFEDELEEVTEPVFETQVTVRLNPGEAEIVKTLANARGTSLATLVQEWVAERIATLSP